MKYFSSTIWGFAFIILTLVFGAIFLQKLSFTYKDGDTVISLDTQKEKENNIQKENTTQKAIKVNHNITSEYTILLFSKINQKKFSQKLSNSFLTYGFNSKSIASELHESKRQLSKNQAWVIYTKRGEKILKEIKRILNEYNNIEFIYEPKYSNLHRGDVQILLF